MSRPASPPPASPGPVAGAAAPAGGGDAGVRDVATAAVRDRDPARRGRVALTVPGGRTVTYAELDERSDRAAQALAALGVRAGDRVPLLDVNSVETFEALFGAQKLGAVPTPVSWRLTAAEVAAVVADCGGSVLLAGAACAALAAAAATLLDGPAADGRPVRVVDLGAQWAGLLAAAEAVDPAAPQDADTVVLQLYTSGTTGRAKGVQLTNRNMAALAAAGATMEFGAASVNLVAMPGFHIGGLGPALIGLMAGATNVVVPVFEPAAVLDLMEHAGVTNAFLVPAAYAMLAAQPGAAERDWSALKVLSYGASPITARALERLLATFRTPMVQVYGMTETTGSIVQLDPADHDPAGPRSHLLRSAGRPYPWVELRIADVATGAALPPGEVGEVLVRSDAVTAGYWRRPEEPATGADGWLHTGDAGYLDAEGYLFLTDRIKDMIVTGAENVYPVEVEDVLAEHPAVADVAVIGVPDERWGETVKAVVVARPGVELDPAELLAWARERLAGYKRPTSVDVVAELPRNPSGKVLKRELRAPYWAGSGRAIG